MPVSSICVRSREYRSFAQLVDPFIDAQYRVRVSYCPCVQISVADKEAKCAILLCQEHKW